jgi:microcystin-dependent protein
MFFYIAQIFLFAGNFAPRNSTFCQGQLLSIAQNTALFSLVGTIYGGDGRTTFGLPDLRGRAPIGAGNGPGLTNRQLGQRNFGESVTLNTTNMPSHNHTATTTVNVSAAPGGESTPVGQVLAAHAGAFSEEGTAGQNLAGTSTTVNNSGGNQSFSIMQPYAAINYCIALTGIFPSRS